MVSKAYAVVLLLCICSSNFYTLMQPFIEYPEDSTTQPIQVSIGFNEDSYNGGGNITFKGNLRNDAEFTVRLFEGELLLGNAPVHFIYSVKSNENSLLGLALEFSSAIGKKKSVLLAAPGNTLLAMNRFSKHFTSVVMPRRVSKPDEGPGWVIQESSIDMRGQVLKEIQAVCYRPKPEASISLPYDNTPFRGPSDYYAVLGDIKIATIGENTNFPPSTSWIIDSQFVDWSSGSKGSKSLSAKIKWKPKDGVDDLFPKYHIYVNYATSASSGNGNEIRGPASEFLGVAVVKSFYISELDVPSGATSLKFIIQVCGLDGASQKLEESPFYVLPVQSS